MSGTINGGKTTAQKNLAKDPDFYRKIALLSQQKWIENGRKPRGFSVMDKDKLRAISVKAGTKSRKPKKVNS